MDEILNFQNYLLAEYPESWSGIDDYIKYMIPHEYLPFMTRYESKYYQEYVPKIRDSEVIYIPINKADSKAKKYRGIFSLYFINFEELFENFDEYYFDIESWSDKRRETVLKKVNEILFECNIFKGLSFSKALSDTILEIKNRLTHIEKMGLLYSTEPNWLQIKIKKSLELEIELIQNTLISNYKLVYPKLDGIFKENAVSTNLSNSNSFLWYKIAEIMATGYLEIEQQHYIINGEKIYNESEVARLISKYFFGNDGKYESIKPFLNQTKSKIKNENKNIFIHSRLKELKS